MQRRLARDTGALAVGTITNGVLAYIFFALVTRDLGAAAAAPISILWTYWSAAGAVLTFPLQHWTIRTLAAEGEAGVARAMRRLWAGTALASIGSGLAAYAARDILFGSDGASLPLLVAAVTAGSCLMGMIRGGLAGRRRFVATAAAMVAENAVRLAAAVAVAVAGWGVVPYGVALAVGPLIGFVWTGSLRYAGDKSGSGVRTSYAGMASGLAIGSLVAQMVLTGAPVVLAAIGGAPAEITSLFVALALWRAPYLIALGLATQLTGFLTHLVVGGQARRLRAVRWATIAAVVAGAGFAAVIGATVAGQVLRLIFGDVGLPRWAMAVLGAGTAVALGNLVLLLLLLARGVSRFASGAWLGGLALAAGIMAFTQLDPMASVVWAFAAAQVAAFALMLGADMVAGAASSPPSPVEAEADATTWAAPPGT